MRVRFKPDSAPWWAEQNKIYLVLGIEADDYRIMSKDGEPILYEREKFDVVDDSIPDEWVVWGSDTDGEYMRDPDFTFPGFFEDYFDGIAAARAKFDAWLARFTAKYGPAIMDP